VDPSKTPMVPSTTPIRNIFRSDFPLWTITPVSCTPIEKTMHVPVSTQSEPTNWVSRCRDCIESWKRAGEWNVQKPAEPLVKQ
jgi:hypothetical protein